MADNEKPSFRHRRKRKRGKCIKSTFFVHCFLDETCSPVGKAEYLQCKMYRFSLKYSMDKKEPLIKVNN